MSCATTLVKPEWLPRLHNFLKFYQAAPNFTHSKHMADYFHHISTNQFLGHWWKCWKMPLAMIKKGNSWICPLSSPKSDAFFPDPLHIHPQTFNPSCSLFGNLAYKQTNQQTNGQGWKQNLLGDDRMKLLTHSETSRLDKSPYELLKCSWTPHWACGCSSCFSWLHKEEI